MPVALTITATDADAARVVAAFKATFAQQYPQGNGEGDGAYCKRMILVWAKQIISQYETQQAVQAAAGPAAQTAQQNAANIGLT